MAARCLQFWFTCDSHKQQRDHELMHPQVAMGGVWATRVHEQHVPNSAFYTIIDQPYDGWRQWNTKKAHWSWSGNILVIQYKHTPPTCVFPPNLTHVPKRFKIVSCIHLCRTSVRNVIFCSIMAASQRAKWVWSESALTSTPLNTRTRHF